MGKTSKKLHDKRETEDAPCARLLHPHLGIRIDPISGAHAERRARCRRLVPVATSPSAAALSPQLPSRLRPIVHKCLQLDPAQRYQHAADVRAALQHSSSNRRRFALASAAVLALAAAAALWYARLHSAPKLTPHDTIVLAEFANESGDASYENGLHLERQ